MPLQDSNALCLLSLSRLMLLNLIARIPPLSIYVNQLAAHTVIYYCTNIIFMIVWHKKLRRFSRHEHARDRTHSHIKKLRKKWSQLFILHLEYGGVPSIFIDIWAPFSLLSLLLFTPPMSHMTSKERKKRKKTNQEKKNCMCRRTCCTTIHIHLIFCFCANKSTNKINLIRRIGSNNKTSELYLFDVCDYLEHNRNIPAAENILFYTFSTIK